MFTLLAVINIVVASFMIGNDYDEIKKYQAELGQTEQTITLNDTEI